MGWRIGARLLNEADQGVGPALAAAHASKTRPLCACTSAGVPMYIACVGGRYLVKRMPDTGSEHDPGCTSYEPPPEVSGLGELLGSAIQEDADAGVTKLRFAFSLSQASRPAPPPASGEEPDSIRTDGTKLTLRSTLHYLWEQAGLHRWAPAMEGKRSWAVVRRCLLAAAGAKEAKGSPLESLLYIPEVFFLDRKEEIAANRRKRLSPLVGRRNGARRLMIAIAEVKGITGSRFGSRLTLKHLPDFPMLLADDLMDGIAKRFASELELRAAHDETHLIGIITFGLTPAGAAKVEELSLMLTDANWVPIDHSDELSLLTTLVRGKRRFAKGLRYNLRRACPIASMVLTDVAPRPAALYLVPSDAGANYHHELQELIEESTLAPWVWFADETMPSLPSTQHYEAPDMTQLFAGRASTADEAMDAPSSEEVDLAANSSCDHYVPCG
jgi:hypothetical protein